MDPAQTQLHKLQSKLKASLTTMRKLYFAFTILLVLIACSKDDTTTPEPEPVQVPKYTATITAGDGGTVSSAGGTYNKDSQFMGCF